MPTATIKQTQAKNYYQQPSFAPEGKHDSSSHYRGRKYSKENKRQEKETKQPNGPSSFAQRQFKRFLETKINIDSEFRFTVEEFLNSAEIREKACAAMGENLFSRIWEVFVECLTAYEIFRKNPNVKTFINFKAKYLTLDLINKELKVINRLIKDVWGESFPELKTAKLLVKFLKKVVVAKKYDGPMFDFTLKEFLSEQRIRHKIMKSTAECLGSIITTCDWLNNAEITRYACEAAGYGSSYQPLADFVSIPLNVFEVPMDILKLGIKTSELYLAIDEWRKEVECETPKERKFKEVELFKALLDCSLIYTKTGLTIAGAATGLGGVIALAKYASMGIGFWQHYHKSMLSSSASVPTAA